MQVKSVSVMKGKLKRILRQTRESSGWCLQFLCLQKQWVHFQVGEYAGGSFPPGGDCSSRSAAGPPSTCTVTVLELRALEPFEEDGRLGLRRLIGGRTASVRGNSTGDEPLSMGGSEGVGAAAP